MLKVHTSLVNKLMDGLKNRVTLLCSLLWPHQGTTRDSAFVMPESYSDKGHEGHNGSWKVWWMQRDHGLYQKKSGFQVHSLSLLYPCQGFTVSNTFPLIPCHAHTMFHLFLSDSYYEHSDCTMHLSRIYHALIVPFLILWNTTPFLCTLIHPARFLVSTSVKLCPPKDSVVKEKAMVMPWWKGYEVLHQLHCW